MRHPFIDKLGLEINSWTGGTSVCSLVIDPEKHHNTHGIVDGSVLFALADSGMGAALASTLDKGEICVTIEIKINYFKAVRDGNLTCRTAIIHRGRTVANLQASVFQGEKLVAQANGSFSILQSQDINKTL
jgi:acyl-CoA thioesterase